MEEVLAGRVLSFVSPPSPLPGKKEPRDKAGERKEWLVMLSFLFREERKGKEARKKRKKAIPHRKKRKP